MTRTFSRLIAPLLATAALALPTAASADFDPVVDWSSVFPSLAPQYDANDPNICVSGKQQCVKAIEKEMTRRYQPLSNSCSHNTLFGLLYLRVTNQVGQDVWTPGRFSDPGFMTHYAAVFADYYFKGYDQWTSNSASTPLSWKIALDAATNKQVQGLGNLLLGMNAHINRDLPYVLYSIGLTAPDGTSRKPDHDRINAVLHDAYDVAIAEAARRFDPSLSAYTGENASDSGIQSVIMWREEAWRNAERLANASSDAERAYIGQQIDQAANLEATAIKAAYSYGPLQNSASRDAFCAAHHNDL